jgi:hypothetical protein
MASKTFTFDLKDNRWIGLSIFWPRINCGRTTDDFGESYFKIIFDAPTQFGFTKYDDFWALVITILGFGVAVSRHTI